MKSEDESAKRANLGRLVRNLGSQGGRAALARRFEFAVKNRRVSVLKIACIFGTLGTILFCAVVWGYIGGVSLPTASPNVMFLQPPKSDVRPPFANSSPPAANHTSESPLPHVNAPVAIPAEASSEVGLESLQQRPTATPVHKAETAAVIREMPDDSSPLSLANSTSIDGPAEVSEPLTLTVMPGSDANHLHGTIGLKPNGLPSWTPEPLTFRMTEEQKQVANKGYCFNTRVSDSLPLDRAVPDFNSKECLNRKYDFTKLEKTSVVIVFHDENLSALLRSIHSVLNRSPPELLEEVILVDDLSNYQTHPWLGQELVDHLKYLPKTRLRRLRTRHGLMRARMAGVEWANGKFVAFLDSHIECAPGWLQPMVQHVHDNPKTVSIPLIHTIDFDNFGFESGHLSVLAFSWSLGQTHPSRPFSESDVIPSPVMAGGLFLVAKDWFNETGGYDPEMRLYGGEEMEIGFKMWMCGGRLEVNPCSRVGHVFRSGRYWKGQVYKVPGEEIHRNKLRVAENWMDEYKAIAKIAISPLPPSMDLGPLDEVQKVRKKLNCKSFDWYLKNVYPEMFVPDLKNSHVGAMQNEETSACFDTLGGKYPMAKSGAYPCHGFHGTQAVLMDSHGDIRPAETDFKLCVVAQGDSLALDDCKKDETGTPTWTYDQDTKLMRHRSDKCLLYSRIEVPNSPFSLTLTECNATDPFQHVVWQM